MRDQTTFSTQEKNRARSIFHKALREGRIVKQRCFCGGVAIAHHEDYSKPLDVMWLCVRHHIERHWELGWGMTYDRSKYTKEKIRMSMEKDVLHPGRKRAKALGLNFTEYLEELVRRELAEPFLTKPTRNGKGK